MTQSAKCERAEDDHPQNASESIVSNSPPRATFDEPWVNPDPVKRISIHRIKARMTLCLRPQ